VTALNITSLALLFCGAANILLTLSTSLMASRIFAVVFGFAIGLLCS
jgi:hypothetical protein